MCRSRGWEQSRRRRVQRRRHRGPVRWFDLHPFLQHYQTLNADGTCSPTGSGGAWNASSGNSNGWQQWSINLKAYAGKSVEISIAYVSDWATQNLGTFIDDVTLPDGSSTSPETGLEGWSITGPPEGSDANANNWIVTDASGSRSAPRSLRPTRWRWLWVRGDLHAGEPEQRHGADPGPSPELILPTSRGRGRRRSAALSYPPPRG
jgi:hypothetical protein